MTNNPLIAKWEELHNPKKEEPKPQKTHTDKLKELRDTSTVSITNSNSPYGITKANPIPSLITYDVDSGKDSFLQVAELVKQNKAKITSMSMSVDATGELFAKTISFEVMVADWDI